MSDFIEMNDNNVIHFLKIFVHATREDVDDDGSGSSLYCIDRRSCWGWFGAVIREDAVHALNVSRDKHVMMTIKMKMSQN